MKLLLFLSALLTGLTGAVSGESRGALAVEQSVAQALERVAEAAVQVAAPVRQVAAAIRSPFVSEKQAAPCTDVALAIPLDLSRVSEKRLD